MTDYTKTTDFAAKDSLPSGDSGKIIKGTEFETEFDNIATAIATKSNIASPTFTGTTTIPTVDINGGAIDAVTLGTNSAVTEAQVDNININGNTISSSDTDGNVNISPNGTGTVVINTDLDVDNINVNGNTVSSTDVNGNINLSPNGTGSVVINTDLDVDNININGNAIISTDTNGNIDLTPNGTGEVNISKVDIDAGAIDGTVIGAASAAAITGTTGQFDTSLNVDGTVTADGLTVNGASTININDSTTYLSTSRANGFLQINNTNTTSGVFSGIELIATGAGSAGAAEIICIDRGDGSGDLAFSTRSGGTWGEKVRILAGGSVGIGTTSPSSYNSAGDNLVIAETSGGAGITIASSTTGSGHILFADGTTGTGAYDGFIRFDHSTSSMRFASGAGVERMRIDSSGQVGIGTASPDNLMHLHGSPIIRMTTATTGETATDGLIFGSNADGSSFLWTYENEHLYFGTNNTERVRITEAGNVGIGTSSPAQTLHLKSADPVIRLEDSNPDGIYAQIDGAGGSLILSADQGNGSANSNIVFKSDNTERMRITSDGNVGIGTSTNLANGTLNVESNGTSVLQARSDTAGVNDGDTTVVVSRALNSTAGKWANAIYRGYSHAWSYGSSASTSEAMRIDSSGNLLVGTTATPTSSAGNIVLANGTAPTASATNGVILYAEDVSSSSELKVRDEAGNITTLSPHNFDLIPQGPSEDMAWSYYSERDGKQINVDMLKAIRVLEKLSGEQLVFEN